MKSFKQVLRSKGCGKFSSQSIGVLSGSWGDNEKENRSYYVECRVCV